MLNYVERYSVPQDQLFISYSHRDARWRDELETHLKPYHRTGSIISWSDQHIAPGSEWFTEIQSALASSKIGVLLVTPSFLNSDFIHEHELGPLLKKAEQGGVKILWIHVSASSYEQSALKKYQAIIDPSKPLAEMPKPKRDRAWVQICKKIQKELAQTSGSRQSPTLGQSKLPESPGSAAESPATSPAGPDSTSKSPQPALEWQDHLGHTYEGIPPAIYTKAVQFFAKNISGRPIELENACLMSRITEETAEVIVGTSGGWLRPSDITRIPAGSEVTLQAKFNPPTGLLAQDFINAWGRMVLYVTYDGATHEVPIGEDMTRAMYASFRPNPLEPMVTRGISKPHADSTIMPPTPDSFSSGQRFLADVGAQVIGEEEQLKAEREHQRHQRTLRAEMPKASWGIIRNNLERLLGKIQAAAPAAERFEERASPSLHLRFG